MKILHVVHGYDPALGGTEWLVKNVSEQLVTRYQDDVTVFTGAVTKPSFYWQDDGERLPVGVENINGVTVRRFSFSKRFQFLRMVMARGFYRLKLPYHDWARTIQLGPTMPTLPNAVAESDADVIMAAAFPYRHMYYALSGAKRAGIPLVFLGAIHTVDKWGYDRKMMYDAIAQADGYIALTSFEKAYLVDKGIAEEKVHVIGAGVDLTPFTILDKTAVRAKYGLQDEPIIGVMSRQTPLKRLDQVIQAMPAIWQRCPQAHLLMAGARTTHSAYLDELITRLPPERQAQIIQIHDFPEAEKPNILAAMDVVVHPSHNESFGIVFVEAWAARKPVIGVNVGPIASLIDADKDGLLFDYEDIDGLATAVLQLLTNTEEGHKMGQAGRQKVETNYTWDVIVDETRVVYEKLLQKNPH